MKSGKSWKAAQIRLKRKENAWIWASKKAEITWKAEFFIQDICTHAWASGKDGARRKVKENNLHMCEQGSKPNLCDKNNNWYTTQACRWSAIYKSNILDSINDEWCTTGPSKARRFRLQFLSHTSSVLEQCLSCMVQACLPVGPLMIAVTVGNISVKS